MKASGPSAIVFFGGVTGIGAAPKIVAAFAFPIEGAISGSSFTMPMRVAACACCACCCCAAYAMIVLASTGASPGAIERVGAIGGDCVR